MTKAPATPKATEPAARTYDPAKLTAITADIAIPANAGKSNRGGRSLYPFDSLEVGQSFGVSNKNAKQLASLVSAANKRHQVDKIGEDGKPVYKTQDVKQADGSISKVPTLETVKVAGRVFVHADVDPKTDPQHASVRVWRQK